MNDPKFPELNTEAVESRTEFICGPLDKKSQKDVPYDKDTVLVVRRYLCLGKPDTDGAHYESAFYTADLGRFIGRLCTCGNTQGHGDAW